MRTILKFSFILLTILLVIIISSCKDSDSFGPVLDYGLITAPATLPDNIPYSLLGTGKIAFERIGPGGGHYSGGYVIDINNRKSNLFLNGSIDAPSISPDGKLIAFNTLTIGSSTDWDIYVIDADGKNKTLVCNLEGNVEGPPAWVKSDGEIIYGVIKQLTIGYSIYKQRPVNTTATYVCGFTGYSDSPISVSGSNKILLSNGRSTSLIIKEPSKGYFDEIKINYAATNDRSIRIYSPQWSPNETEIACTITETDSTFNNYKISIIKMNPDGNNLKVLTAYEANNQSFYIGSNDFSLCWSPDGSKILFNKYESGVTSHIYVMNADGSQITQVTTLVGVYDRSVSWSN